MIYLAEYLSFKADYMWKSESDREIIYGKYRHFVKIVLVSSTDLPGFDDYFVRLK